MRQRAIRCALMRGGTSKGAYFLAADLPASPEERDALLLSIMGSPDATQVDGLGGGHPLRSKVAIVSPSTAPDADVDFLFAQVSVEEPLVDTSPNCGNILAGVGPFAIERRLPGALNRCRQMFGELLATSRRAHAIAGLVIDAGVRDVADLTAMDFPVGAKAISAQGTVKASPGSVNVEVVCAGALVRPGDCVGGDQDGVVIVRREMAAEIAQLGAARIEKERKSRERLKAGELGVDFYGLRAKLIELGVEYIGE